MKGLAQLTAVNAKLFLREPAAFFFTLVFPALLLVVFGVIFGNEPMTQWGMTIGYIDLEVPALAAIIIGSVALMSIPIATSTAREQGILRRFRATPVATLTLIASEVIVYLAMCIAGMAVLVVLGRLFFDLRFSGSWPVVIAGFALSAIAFFALGYVIASLSPSARVAQAVGMSIFFPAMFLSGAALPRQIMPADVVALSDWLPLTQVVTLLQGIWFGKPLLDHATELAWLAAMLLVGTVVSVRFFRWE